ncbi:MAG: folate-binding protein [Gammaproteobacteria bacterium]|nr:folate-binding protein [Gammaproteobacteria bacterium]
MHEQTALNSDNYYGQDLLNKLWLCDLAHESIVFAHGLDLDAFLQAQLTNDVHLLTEVQSQLQGYCTPKGRLLCIFRIARWQDGILMLLPRELEDSIIKRLRLYVLRADVRLTPMSEQLSTFGIVGRDPESELLSQVYGPLPTPPHGCKRAGERLLLAIDAPVPRYQVVGPTDVLEDDRRRLSQAYAPQSPQLWSWLDILAGLPHIRTDTQELFVPQMANLDILGGVNFKKGCYPGQEIVARMRYLGKIKQRMIRVHVESGEPPLPGEKIYAPDRGEQSAGTIVNSAPNPDGGYEALAVVQRSSIAHGDLRLRSLAGQQLTIRNLPYSIDIDE